MLYQNKMTQYNTLNVKLSNSLLDKLKCRIKNGTNITLKISSNIVGDSNDKNNFPHKLSLLLYTSFKSLKNFPKWFVSKYKIIKNSIV